MGYSFALKRAQREQPIPYVSILYLLIEAWKGDKHHDTATAIPTASDDWNSTPSH